MTDNTFSLISLDKERKTSNRTLSTVSTSAKVYKKSLESYKVAVDTENVPPYDWSVLFLHQIAMQGTQNEPSNLGTLFTFKTLKRKYQCSAYNFDKSIKKDTQLFDKFFSSLKKHGSRYINEFNFPLEPTVSKELFKIIFSELELWKTGTVDEINGAINTPEEKSTEFHTPLDSKTKVSLKNWQDVYATRSIIDEENENKLGSFGFEGYPSILVAENDNYVCMASIQPSNQHFIDDRVLEIDNNLTISFVIFEATKAREKLVPFYKNISSSFNMYIQFIYGQDLNKNIESSIGEASEIARYWYTDGLQELNQKQDEFNKATDSFTFSKSFIEEILAKDIPGVDTIEVYPFDRIFIFKQSVLDLDYNENEIEMFVAEALLEQRSMSEHDLVKDRDNYVYEWERDKFTIPDYDINFNHKRLEFNKFSIRTETKHGSSHSTIVNETGDIVALDIEQHVDGGQSIEAVINDMLFNILTTKIEKKKLLEYEGKYFENGLCYIYSQGLRLSDLPQLKKLVKAYWNSLLSLNDRYENIESFGAKILDELDDTKVVLASYKPNKSDGDNKEAFTMLIIADKDIPKTQSELGAEKDDLHTAYKLMVRQQTETAELNRNIREEIKNLVIKQLGQAVHNIKGKVGQGIQHLIEDMQLKKNEEATIIQHRDKILEAVDTIKEKFDNEIKKDSSEIKYIKIQNDSGFMRTIDLYRELIEKHTYELQRPSELYDQIAKEIIGLKSSNPSIYNLKLEHTKTKIDFNFFNFGLPAIEIPDHYLLHETFHTLLKNAVEATTSCEQIEKSISIYSNVIGIGNGDGVLHIEINNTTGQLSKTRLDEINEAVESVTSDSTKVGSTGFGVASSRAQLNNLFGDKAKIVYTMIEKHTIRCRLTIPVKMFEILDNYGEEGAQERAQEDESAHLFYLEDDDFNYSRSIEYFEEDCVSYKHATSLTSFTSNYTDEKILVTDLNILKTDKDSDANTTQGYNAIKYHLSKQPSGIVIIISTVGVDEIKEELATRNKIDESKIHLSLEENLQSGHLYIYNEHKFLSKNNIPKALEELFTGKKVSADSSLKSSFEVTHIDKDLKSSLSRSFDELSEVYQHSILSYPSKPKKALFDIIDSWINHDLKTDLGFDEQISNPDEFSSVLILPVQVSDLEVDPILLNYFGMKNNIVFILLLDVISPEDLNDKVEIVLTIRQKMKLKSNGLFSAIRHDINKVNDTELIQQLLTSINKLDELTKLNVEHIFGQSDIEKNKRLLTEVYAEYAHVINEVTSKQIAMGGVSIQNHKELLNTLDLFIQLNTKVIHKADND